MTEQQIKEVVIKEAVTDFTGLCEAIGFDFKRAYICMQKAKGKSYAQIGNILGMKRDEVRNAYRYSCGRKPPHSVP